VGISILKIELKIMSEERESSQWSLLLTHFLPFPQSINFDYASQCNKSSTPSLLIWFWLKFWFFSFPWNYGFAHGHILRALSRTSEWRTASEIIFGFDLNTTSSWWRTWNSRGACLF
jgi:hypothetical protein